METVFVDFLRSGGIADATLTVLEDEAVDGFRVFGMLHEEHIQKLIGKIPLGQHAVLTKLWQKTMDESEFRLQLLRVHVARQ